MNRLIINVFFALNLMAWAPSALQAQQTPERLLEIAFNSFVENNEIAGAVGLVADKQGVVAVHSVGFADISGNQAMTRDSIFWIASMSKARDPQHGPLESQHPRRAGTGPAHRASRQ